MNLVSLYRVKEKALTGSELAKMFLPGNLLAGLGCQVHGLPSK